MQRKAMGLISGVSDCLFIWHGRVYCFEFKTETGRQSPSQIEWMHRVNQQGINYYIIRSLEQFKTQINELLVG
jgi:penicillin-binding protein-related factor A (putative recombinase)